MFNLKSAFIGLCSAFLMAFSSYAAGIGLDSVSLNNTPHIQHNTTIGLKPVQPSYKIARLQYLPDLTDSETGWAGNIIPTARPTSDKCSYYPLASCPAGGNCTKCPFGNKYKLNSCQSGWRINGNSCIAASCSALNKSYLAAIPDNQICSKVTEGGLTCYKDCRAVACSAYPLDSTKVTDTNVRNVSICPDCLSDNANCNPFFCKISKCADGYKVNAEATKCVEKDDSCPNNYFKTCETSVIGDPKYTEKGTACYQCKAKEPETCSKYVEANFPDYTRIGSSSDLQHALIDGKNNFVVVNDFTLNADVDLSGKTIMGANEIASASPLCANTPKITTEKSITTNNNTKMSSLHINSTKENPAWQNPLPAGYGDDTYTIRGGGTFKNMTLTSDTTNSYNYLLVANGNVVIENLTTKGYKIMAAEDKANVTFKGTIDFQKGSSDWSYLIGAGGAPTITIASDAIINNPNEFQLISSYGYGAKYSGTSAPQSTTPTINIEGTINFSTEALANPSGTVRTFSIVDVRGGTINVKKGINAPRGEIRTYNGTININGESTLSEIYISEGCTLNINAKTTFIADYANAKGISSSFRSYVNINAPVYFKGYAKITDPDYWLGGEGPIGGGYIYINSDFISDNFTGFGQYTWIDKVTLGPKANVRGLGRMRLDYDYADAVLEVQTGAKLEIGNVCKKATSNATLKGSGKNILDYKTPPSPPFTGGC